VRRAAALLVALAPAAAAATEPAQANYMLHCMGCHVSDGSGAAGKVPSVRDSLPRLVASAAGRRFLVQVPGASQSTLTDAELAAVLNWMVRTLSAAPVPAAFRDYSAAEVASYRHAPLVDVSGTRARLLSPARAGG